MFNCIHSFLYYRPDCELKWIDGDVVVKSNMEICLYVTLPIVELSSCIYAINYDSHQLNVFCNPHTCLCATPLLQGAFKVMAQYSRLSRKPSWKCSWIRWLFHMVNFSFWLIIKIKSILLFSGDERIPEACCRKSYEICYGKITITTI